MLLLQSMDSECCKKFQRCPLKFHTKFGTHTQQNMHFTRCWKFDQSWYIKSYDIWNLRRAPGYQKWFHQYSDVTRTVRRLIITNNSTVCLLIFSDQHWWDSHHKGPVMWPWFPRHDVIMWSGPCWPVAKAITFNQSDLVVWLITPRQ